MNFYSVFCYCVCLCQVFRNVPNKQLLDYLSTHTDVLHKPIVFFTQFAGLLREILLTFMYQNKEKSAALTHTHTHKSNTTILCASVLTDAFFSGGKQGHVAAMSLQDALSAVSSRYVGLAGRKGVCVCVCVCVMCVCDVCDVCVCVCVCDVQYY